MPRESNFWKYVKRGMGKRWDAERIENGVGVGTPDVAFGMQGINGWIELKAIEAWPKREETRFRIKHFTDDQRRWLTRRGRTGGNCWVFLRVAREYLLFHWVDVVELGCLNREGTRNLAHARWEGTVDWDEFADCLLGKCGTPVTKLPVQLVYEGEEELF